MKKLLLSFIMILLPVVASEASIVVDGISYNINGNEAEIRSLPDEYKSGDVVIPASFYYNGMKFNVTSIGNNVFNSCADLTGITIPKGVRTIGGNAFTQCKALTSITIPEGVTSIGPSAFFNCTNLTSVTIPSSVKEIGSGAFANTAWYKNQPDGLIYINNVAYKYKGTMQENTSITIKEGTSSISGNAFYNCANLTDISIPEGVTNIGSEAFRGCTGLTSIAIPEGVINIGGSSFYGCTNLTSITIPSSVNEIGYYAFENTAWYNNQPNGLIYIGNVAYKYKGTMQANVNIEIKEGTSSISSYAFDKCNNLTSINIPKGMTTIGINAFRECTGLTSISIPEGVTSIGSSAFYWCQNLTSVTIPSSIKEIGTSAFNFCNIKDVYISDLDAWCNIRFGNEDFDYEHKNQGSSPVHGHLYLNNKEVTEVHIPEGQTSISPYAFSGCSNIKSVSIPNSVVEIGVYSFSGCNNLSSIIIPRGVQVIPEGVFLSCKLEKIVLRTPNIYSNPTIHSPFSQATYNHVVLYVPMGSKWDMIYENGWYPFINIREVADETEDLSDAKAYTLLNSKTLKYSVYDAVNNKVRTVDNLDNIDESVASNSWQIVDNQGKNYLYNIGAKKFASITSSGDIELSEQAKPISMENGANGIILGDNSDSQWNFVLNEKVSAEQIVTNVESISDITPSAAIYYDLNGREIPTPQKGMNIVKKANGQTIKIFVK